MEKSTLITLLLLMFWQSKADQWTDPSWREMIAQSDVIALVEYTSEGDFKAQAKPIVIYKGKLKADVIWISGFSNRYGPIDKMPPGDRYVVFLTFYEPTEEVVRNWTDRVKDDSSLKNYFDALKAGNAYYVWSPTSGDLKVRGDKVQYDLLETTFYGDQRFHPLKEFEVFLQAALKGGSAAFHKETLEKVRRNTSNEKCAQYLMMLTLTSFQGFDTVYERLLTAKTPRLTMHSRNCWARCLATLRETCSYGC